MAAKLLHSLTDENPDLKKQMGCMTGIFQLFDRHHIFTGRHISGHSPRGVPPGSSHTNRGSPEAEPYNIYHRQKAKDKTPGKSVHERQRISIESSRASFSSSSRSSSFSSPDCNRIAQPVPLSIGPIVFAETPLRDMAMNQSNASPQHGRQMVDLRDRVKDSIYREARVPPVTSATKEVATDHALMHGDSPRSLQISKTVDGSHSIRPGGKQNLPVDLKESLRVLAKLQDAPRYFNDTKESSRSSCELKDGSLYSTSKDTPRFSYDGRDINHLSFESRDVFKTTPKLKELPRLSFDSTEVSMRGFNSDIKSNFPKNSQDSDNSNICSSNLQQTSVSLTRPPSVVAKLMGLEALPDSALASDIQTGLIRTSSIEGSHPLTKPFKSTDPCRSIRISNSPKNSSKELTSPRWKNPDSGMKPVSRFPIEPAPWKQPDRSQSLQKPSFNNRKGPVMKTPDSFPSVYCEIEKRLKDLEFTQSGKDLRALKQILETMQAKGILETRREEQGSNFARQRNQEQKHLSPDQRARLVSQQKPQSEHVVNSTDRGDSSRTFKSPIVIMKPAKLTENLSSHSSLTSTDGLSGLSKFRGGDFVDGRKGLVNREMAKDRIPKVCRRDNTVNPSEIKTSSRNLKLAQTSTRSQQLPKENTASSIKSSGSVSPRLQQKKLELEKRSRPPTHPSDSSKSRRQSSKQQPDSGSPGGKRKPKSSNLHQSDESELSSETGNLVYQDDELSLRSDSIVALDLNMDVNVTSSDQPAETHDCRSPSMKAAKCSVSSSIHQKSVLKMCNDGSLMEIATVAPEHPSPVSVLDGTVCRDDEPSPVKQLLGHLEDNGTWNSNKKSSIGQWDAADNLLPNSLGFSLTSELSRKKLHNVEQLVQKLRRLNSNHDEARTDYIASLCEDTNPDHRYISEILLASGLLLRDLGSSLATFQLHPSGHPINPELFLVLEQTKGSISLTDECSHETVVHSKPDKEKFHRKLIFDAVNEILAGKLAAVVPSPEPWLRPNKLARKPLSAQKLLRELCSEVEQLQTKEFGSSLEDRDDDLKSILCNDVMHRSESWTDFQNEMHGVVLDVERSIFKDLVGEVLTGDAAGLRARPGRRCRQLFAK